MKNPVRVIEGLLKCLPERDQRLAHLFIEERDFDSLQELVYSDLTKEQKKVRKRFWVDQFDSAVLPQLEVLHYHVCAYVDLLYNEISISEDVIESDGVDMDTFADRTGEDDH